MSRITKDLYEATLDDPEEWTLAIGLFYIVSNDHLHSLVSGMYGEEWRSKVVIQEFAKDIGKCASTVSQRDVTIEYFLAFLVRMAKESAIKADLKPGA